MEEFLSVDLRHSDPYVFCKSLCRLPWYTALSHGSWKCMMPPCVVLVINDNTYGLMFSFRYFCRFVHRHHLNSMCWIQGWMPSRSLLIMNIFDMIKKKNGHDNIEHIASMSWRKILCEHSCLPSRHHHYEERGEDTWLIK